jgi:type VI secretion system secreted protein VgrG
VLVKDPTKPPTQDNLRKIVELKFPGDTRDREQMQAYRKIAGKGRGDIVEVWTLEKCGCGKEEPAPQPVPAPVPSSSADKIAALLLALAILALILDDAVGGEADDLLIPELIEQMLGKLKPAF